jgi:hypothetical protein
MTLEENIFERFEQEMKLRKELEIKLLLLIEEKSISLQNEINKEKRNRNESLKIYQNIIIKDIPEIKENLGYEQNQMIQSDSNIITKINNEKIKLLRYVIKEKKSREETEKALMEIIRAMFSSIKSEFENEKRKRCLFLILFKIIFILLNLLFLNSPILIVK